MASSIFGVLTSLSLHVLLLSPVLMGASLFKRHPPIPQDPSTGENEAMTWVRLDESDAGTLPAVSIHQSASTLPSQSAPLQPMGAPEAALPANIDGLQEITDDEGADKDPQQTSPANSMVAGRYLGQIDARIERAWLRPRRPLASGFFKCRVRIAQDASGRVQEVEIISCNGDTPWQTSLVHAIESASPLPAPPNPEVFSHTVTLEFRSRSFGPDEDPAGFEPERRTPRSR